MELGVVLVRKQLYIVIELLEAIAAFRLVFKTMRKLRISVVMAAFRVKRVELKTVALLRLFG